MEFRTQRELLEYLGKNENDRNLVQRLIIKGEVVREWDMYVLVDKDARIAELEKEVERLRNGIVTTKESDWEDERSENVTQGNNALLEKVASLESDVNYLNGEYEKMEAKLINYQEAIRNCYKRARDVKKDRTPWPEFKKDILKLEEDVSWEDNQ